MTRDPFEQRVPPSPQAPELGLTGYLPASTQQRSVMPPPGAVPPTASALQSALDRLEDLIDQENQALKNNDRIDFADINRRKSQSLLELTRLGRSLPPGRTPALRDRLAVLRGKLGENHRALGLHLAAVREISDIMVGALNEAVSDGTYGKTRPRRELPR
jgi:hypothetical protein